MADGAFQKDAFQSTQLELFQADAFQQDAFQSLQGDAFQVGDGAVTSAVVSDLTFSWDIDADIYGGYVDWPDVQVIPRLPKPPAITQVFSDLEISWSISDGIFSDLEVPFTRNQIVQSDLPFTWQVSGITTMELPVVWGITDFYDENLDILMAEIDPDLVIVRI